MEREKEIYNNRANIAEGEKTHDCTGYDCCDELLVFALKDKHHEFSLGLSTVLKCLSIAEKEGYVPKLPYEWWVDVS